MRGVDTLDLARRLLAAHPSPGVRAADLAAALDDGVVVHVGPGGALCTEGEPGDSLFLLVAGEVRAQRRDPNGRMRELAVLRAPSLLGHVAIIDHSPRSASCVALGPVTVVGLDRRAVQRLLSEATDRGAALRRLLLSSLTRQLSAGNERLRELMREGDLVEDVEDDVSNTDLADVAGILDGWSVRPREGR